MQEKRKINFYIKYSTKIVQSATLKNCIFKNKIVILRVTI